MYTVESSAVRDPQKALETVRLILMQNNFRVRALDASRLEASGPGMNSTHENPLTGASTVYVSMQNGRVALEADLGGVRWMQKFIYFFPLGLGLFLGIVLGLSLHDMRSVWVSLLAVSPWLVLSPLMSCWMGRRTENALKTMVENAAQNS